MSGFATGFIVGQLSVLIVMAIVIRFFIFADSPGPKLLPQSEAKLEVQPSESQTVENILERTYYNIDSHGSESMDWFTVLLALIVRSMREQAIANENLLRELNRILKSDKVPSFIDSIKITELNLGSDFPLLNNCRVYRTTNTEFSNGLEVRFDIDLKDTITLGIDTRLMLNYPKSMLAYLPIAGSVSLVNFSGRISISLVTDESNRSFITVSFAPSFNMEFKVTSLVGGRSKLQNVPKLGQLIESTLRKRFADNLVAPNFRKFRLPGWPIVPQTPEMRPQTDPTSTQRMATEARAQRTPPSNLRSRVSAGTLNRSPLMGGVASSANIGVSQPDLHQRIRRTELS